MRGPTYLEMVVRTNARASKALFLSSSPRIPKTLSFSDGDKSSEYRFKRLSLFTSSGKTYHKWLSLQNPSFLRRKSFILIKQSSQWYWIICVVNTYIRDGSWTGSRGEWAEQKLLWRPWIFILKNALRLNKNMHTTNLWHSNQIWVMDRITILIWTDWKTKQNKNWVTSQASSELSWSIRAKEELLWELRERRNEERVPWILWICCEAAY